MGMFFKRYGQILFTSVVFSDVVSRLAENVRRGRGGVPAPVFPVPEGARFTGNGRQGTCQAPSGTGEKNPGARFPVPGLRHPSGTWVPAPAVPDTRWTFSASVVVTGY